MIACIMRKETRVISVRGMPSDLKDGMDRISEARRQTHSSVYSDAISALAHAVDAGDRILDFPESTRSGIYRVKLPSDIVDHADAAIKKCGHPVKKSSFVREAARRYVMAASNDQSLV